MTSTTQQDGLTGADIGLADGRQSPAALAIQRGVTRLLAQFNIACLPEVSLPNHRRADLMALTDKGEIWIIEIKSGLADFQADDKWPDYLPYGAEIMRDNKQEKLAAARRNLLLRRMARIGGFRWARLMEKSGKN